MTVLLRLVALPLLILMILGACAKSQDDDPGAGTPAKSTPVTVTPGADPLRGLPDGVIGDVESSAGIAMGSDRQLFVITFGSSSNPAVVHEAVIDGQNITVDVSAKKDDMSTMDFMPTTSTIELPDSVDLDRPITVELGEFGTVTLDAPSPGAEAWVEPKK